MIDLRFWRRVREDLLIELLDIATDTGTLVWRDRTYYVIDSGQDSAEIESDPTNVSVVL